MQRRSDPTHTPDRDRLPCVVADGRGALAGASLRVALRSSVRGDVADQRDEPGPRGAERLAAGRLEAEAVLLKNNIKKKIQRFFFWERSLSH